MITAFKIRGYMTSDELYKRIESAYSNISDMSKPAPRYRILLVKSWKSKFPQCELLLCFFIYFGLKPGLHDITIAVQIKLKALAGLNLA